MQFPKEPLVSIVIPVYNGSNYMREAIDSALAQTYRNIEIIVVNDGSKDNGATDEIARSYGDQIRYIPKENGGSSSALNTGIRNMKGEWFSWLSHDDLYAPEKVEKQVALLNELNLPEEEQWRHFFFTASETVDRDGKRICIDDEKYCKTMAERLQNLPGNEYLVAEPTRYCFHGCGCLIHKRALEAVGMFDEKLRLVNDLDLWFRLYSQNYVLHFLPLAVTKGRVHAKQISRCIGFSYHNPEQDMIRTRSLSWLKDNHPDNEELFCLFGREAIMKTRYDEGRDAFAFAMSLNPEKKQTLQREQAVLLMKARAIALAKKVYLALFVR